MVLVPISAKSMKLLIALSAVLTSFAPFDASAAVAVRLTALDFNPFVIPAGGTSVLTFQLSNPPPNNPAQVVGFTDTLPAGVRIADKPNIGGTCTGGAVTAPAGGNTIVVSDKIVPASATTFVSCSVTVDVTNAAGVPTSSGCYGNVWNPVFVNASDNFSGLSNAVIDPNIGSCLHVNADTVRISKLATGALTPGSALTYTIAITNFGTSPIAFAAVRDPAVEGFIATDVICRGACITLGPRAPPIYTVANLQSAGGAPLSTLAPNSTATLTLTGTFTKTSGPVVNTATVLLPGGTTGAAITMDASATVAALTAGVPPTAIPTTGRGALLLMMLLVAVAAAARFVRINCRVRRTC